MGSGMREDAGIGLDAFDLRLLRLLVRIPGITGIRPSIVLEKIKPFRGLPLAQPAA
jgi:hypothetical protein